MHLTDQFIARHSHWGDPLTGYIAAGAFSTPEVANTLPNIFEVVSLISISALLQLLEPRGMLTSAFEFSRSPKGSSEQVQRHQLAAFEQDIFEFVELRTHHREGRANGRRRRSHLSFVLFEESVARGLIHIPSAFRHTSGSC